MKLNLNYLLLFCTVLFLGCSSDATLEKQVKTDKQLEHQESKISGSDLVQRVTKDPTPAAEKVKNKEKIEAKYGKQLNFCGCVHLNDSINKAGQKEMNDKQVEQFMKALDEVDKQCKQFFTLENRTPEERELHALKVKKCLENK